MCHSGNSLSEFFVEAFYFFVVVHCSLSSTTESFLFVSAFGNTSDRMSHISVHFRLASSWESDISVHALTLPSATCLELLLVLLRSSATLPASLRHVNSFQVRNGSFISKVWFFSLTHGCFLRMRSFSGDSPRKPIYSPDDDNYDNSKHPPVSPCLSLFR